MLDFVVIGSGFGGSVSAMRLAEKGYSVLVFERGKRYEDRDFPTTNWNIFKFLWAPALRCFGFLQFSLFKDVLALHGSGVGGGSLGYANVLMIPDDRLFDHPSWNHLADWKKILQPHYQTARRMLGVTTTPQFFPGDEIMRQLAQESGNGGSFKPVEVGVFFGEGDSVEGPQPDPYFDGSGPSRQACRFCGGCMVGCRYNAKNTLVKNYLYFAEKWGAVIQPECLVTDVRPLPAGQHDGARYEVIFESSTAWLFKPKRHVRARNVVFSGGTIGTLRLLLRCRERSGSLPAISPRLGEVVRTNSESILGVSARKTDIDFSKGLAIHSIFKPDEATAVEPVRYPAGSSLIRLLSAPLMENHLSIPRRFLKTAFRTLAHPIDFLVTHVLPGWARRTTILLVMQTEDNLLHFKLARSFLTSGRKDLVSQTDDHKPIPPMLPVGHALARQFAAKIGGIEAGSVNESLFDIPVTAHILGGCPFGRDAAEGVIDLNCQIHNYPGLYVVDGSTIPGNPGVNPSLTITALAEYAMSCIPIKPNVHPIHGAPENAQPGLNLGVS
jgi:cholesterol oxidase